MSSGPFVSSSARTILIYTKYKENRGSLRGKAFGINDGREPWRITGSAGDFSLRAERFLSSVSEVSGRRVPGRRDTDRDRSPSGAPADHGGLREALTR